jgi:hypothetical protein
MGDRRELSLSGLSIPAANGLCSFSAQNQLSGNNLNFLSLI